MKINKALKIKNRKVGKINSLRSLIIRENSKYIKHFNFKKIEGIFEEYRKELRELIDLKAKIQKATAPIAHLLIEMAEAKGELAFYKTVPHKSGEHEKDSYNDNTVIEKWEAYLDQDGIDNTVNALQKLIEHLQDEIDDYNATTSI